MIAFAAGAALAGAALIVLSAGIVIFGAAALVASAGMIVLGAGMIVAAAGAVILAAALIGINSQMKTIASNAKSAEKSLKTMQKSVKAVESGLNALGSKVKSAMSKLVSAFDDTAGKAESAGKKVAEGFTMGLLSGLVQAPVIANQISSAVAMELASGANDAYTAGAFISQGFANGMLSMLGVIQSAASRMASAADKAVRAKAKINSPSRVADKLGKWWGEGYEGGLLDTVKSVWDAAERLVSIPSIATPDLAMAYSGELSSDYDYYRRADYTIEVPLTLDGKEVARATASYTQDELDKRQTRDDRKRGKI